MKFTVIPRYGNEIKVEAESMLVEDRIVGFYREADDGGICEMVAVFPLDIIIGVTSEPKENGSSGD